MRWSGAESSDSTLTAVDDDADGQHLTKTTEVPLIDGMQGIPALPEGGGGKKRIVIMI